MTANTATRKLNALLTSFERRRPMRAGSLIVTIYGDAIVPRGGSLWLGSLLDMMAGFGVEPGLVRTAISRLVSRWLVRAYARRQAQLLPPVRSKSGGICSRHHARLSRE